MISSFDEGAGRAAHTFYPVSGEMLNLKSA